MQTMATMQRTAQTATQMQRTASESELTIGGVPFPRYMSVSEVARVASVDRRWVTRQCRRLDIQPALTLGEWQFGRATVVRLLMLAQLQLQFGESSPVPFALVEAATPAVNDLLANPSEGTVVACNRGGRLNVIVSVPGLAELLGT
jgi:hypothetical protein